MTDVWNLIHPNDLGFTYQHNALSNYRARLDRWYLLYAHQYETFVCKMWVDHTLQLSDNAPLWLGMYFDLQIDETPLHIKRLLHINVAFTNAASFDIYVHFRRSLQQSIRLLQTSRTGCIVLGPL